MAEFPFLSKVPVKISQPIMFRLAWLKAHISSFRGGRGVLALRIGVTRIGYTQEGEGACKGNYCSDITFTYSTYLLNAKWHIIRPTVVNYKYHSFLHTSHPTQRFQSN